jgi:hypothetical protein
MKMRAAPWILVLAASWHLPPSPEAEGGARRHRAAFLDGYVIEKVADTGTPVPGGVGAFAEFGTPSIGGGTVAFRGDGADGQKGVYSRSGGALGVVADLHTPVPGGEGHFASFDPAVLDGGISVSSEGTVAFRGRSLTRLGLFTNATGPLSLLVDDTFATPGQPAATFANFFHLSHDGGQVAFTAVSDGFHQGLYIADGSALTVVADSNTLIPDGTVTFSDFGLSGPGGHPSLHAGEVAFVGSGGHPYHGVYRYRAGELSTVADQDTPVPGGGTTFASFSAPDIHGGEVVFRSGGIYRAGTGGLARVARGLDAGVAGLAYAFGPPAIHGGQVVFDRQLYYVIEPYIAWRLKVGLYTRADGWLQTVVDGSRASRIDGKRVKEVVSGQEALSDGVFAFKATFADGAQGIYVARPEVGDAGRRPRRRSAAAAILPQEG